MASQLKYQSLLSIPGQRRISAMRERTVSAQSTASAMSIASSCVSEMLDAEIRRNELKVECLDAYRAELQSIFSRQKLSANDFYNELDDLNRQERPLVTKVGVLKRQRRAIEADLEEEVEFEKRRRLGEPDLAFLERAYKSAILPRVMAACDKQKKDHFNGRDFRKEVLKYYNAVSEGTGSAWCHVTGRWFVSSAIKAAHLVPKCLTSDETFYLFGVDNSIRYDPRVAITLHEKVEEALDRGLVAIVPVVESENHPCGRWRLILVDESLRVHTCYRYLVDPNGEETNSNEVKWKDLDGKELKWRGDNRPAKRYLYFRFLVTYFNAQREGHFHFTKGVEGKQIFWSSPGPWLRKSTLTSLARSISGLELPPSIFEDATFADGTLDAERCSEQEVLAGITEGVRNAIIRSAVAEEREGRECETIMDEEESDDMGSEHAWD